MARLVIAGEEAAVEAIATLFTARTGVELRPNRRELVRGRLAPRMRKLGLKSYQEYRKFLETNLERELPHVLGLLTTHKTEFFREAEQLEHRREAVVKPTLAARKPLRIWSAAASTGEEAYSIAMIVAEELIALGLDPRRYSPGITILGTDVDALSIAKAANGVFAERTLGGLTSQRLKAWFQSGSGPHVGYFRIHDALHAMCRFERFNLLEDQQNEKFDAVICRNVFIYFTEPNIARATKGLLGALRTEGHLYVGLSEPFASPVSSLVTVGQSIYRHRLAAEGEQGSKASKTSMPPQQEKARTGNTRVLIVDDSRTVRLALRSALEKRGQFEIVAEASCPREARKALAAHKVDVMTLDINMPEESGIAYLESVNASPGGMSAHPPVVIISSMNPEDASIYLRCVELGAFAYIEKTTNLADASLGLGLGETLKAAAGPTLRSRSIRASGEVSGKSSTDALRSAPGPQPVSESDLALPKTKAPHPLGTEAALMLVGSSTGGTVALAQLFADFPDAFPPVVVTQHIPAAFVPTLVQNLGQTTRKKVVAGAHGDLLDRSTIYIIPGNVHGRIVDSRGLRLEFSNDPAVNGHKPSVDILFASAAALNRRNAVVALLLTGMGDDGAQGLLKLKEAGATTICQDAASCVVYGMPRAAVELGAAMYQLNLNSLAVALFGQVTAISRKGVA
ncbi:MAG: response regulator [Silvanigrellales bacterium]|nr:response regulator [Silvanigrellales bacterium]